MSVAVPLREEDIQAALDALRSGWLTMGPRIQALEAEVAERFGAAHAIAVSSGAAGLHLACLAAGVGPDAGAVVSALAPAAAVNAARYAGGPSHAADAASPHEPGMTVATAAAALRPGSAAVIASHLVGRPVDAAQLRAFCDAQGLLLIEDATQALGAALPDGRPAGTAGHLGVYDFSPGHVVAVGEGGMVVTDDDELAQRVRHLRAHAMTSVTWDRHRGHAESYDIVAFGFNFRMDEPRAALAASQLARLDELVGERRALEAGVLAAVGRPVPAAIGSPSPQAVAVVFEDAGRRDAAADEMAANGVPVGRWPDEWGAEALPPVAADARARTVLIDLGECRAMGLGPETLGEAVERGVPHV